MSDIFCTIDANRKKGLLFNVPPTRFTPISPYETNPSITQYELDMRRKVEILKYKKNTVGALSKKQQFSQAIKGATQRRNYSQTQIADIQIGENTELVCPPTISTSAGVPGPAFYLSLDTNVPLYNYIVTRNYATENQEDTETKWLYTQINDVVGNDIKIATLNIRKPIDQAVYFYTFTTSVGVQIRGSKSFPGGDTKFSTKLITDDVNIIVKYGDVPITQLSTPVVSFSPGFLTDISGNVTANAAFSGSIYMGNMTVTNLALLTSPGYTYDIWIKYIPSNTFTNINGYVSTIITDVKTSFSNTVKKFESGLTFSTPVPATSIVPFSLTGT
jgi:hypothetical protein